MANEARIKEEKKTLIITKSKPTSAWRKNFRKSKKKITKKTRKRINAQKQTTNQITTNKGWSFTWNQKVIKKIGTQEKLKKQLARREATFEQINYNLNKKKY